MLLLLLFLHPEIEYNLRYVRKMIYLSNARTLRWKHDGTRQRQRQRSKMNCHTMYVLLFHTISGETIRIRAHPAAPASPVAVAASSQPTSSLRAIVGTKKGEDMTSNRFAHFYNWFSLAGKGIPLNENVYTQCTQKKIIKKFKFKILSLIMCFFFNYCIINAICG